LIKCKTFWFLHLKFKFISKQISKDTTPYGRVLVSYEPSPVSHRFLSRISKRRKFLTVLSQFFSI